MSAQEVGRSREQASYWLPGTSPLSGSPVAIHTPNTGQSTEMGLLRGCWMRGDDMLRLGLECSSLAVAGLPYEATLAIGIQALLSADAGAGVTTWRWSRDDRPTLVDVVAAGAPTPSAKARKRAQELAPQHPTFNGAGWARPTHRVSDLVYLPSFWQTEVWRVFHGYPDGRFPAAVILRAREWPAVLVGVQRTRRNFDADDLSVLDLIREPLSEALAFRAAWEAAASRFGIVHDSAGRLTDREHQVVGLVALGWTNARIGRHLKISERTVRRHLENVNDKLGTANRAAAACTVDRSGAATLPSLPRPRRPPLGTR